MNASCAISKQKMVSILASYRFDQVFEIGWIQPWEVFIMAANASEFQCGK